VGNKGWTKRKSSQLSLKVTSMHVQEPKTADLETVAHVPPDFESIARQPHAADDLKDLSFTRLRKLQSMFYFAWLVY
jgi:hypothetical protein